MKTHFAYISFIIVCTLSMGWLAATYSSKSTNKAETIQILEKEIGLLRNMRDRPEDIFRALHSAYPAVPEYKLRHYTLMIHELSGRFNISWSLIAATIWIESRFDPTLESSMQAKGLMQLLENTAADQAKKTGIRYTAGKTVWDDITNLFLGTHYLHEAFEKEKDCRQVAYYYLAGPQWRKTINRSSQARHYLLEYASSVIGEMEKLDKLYLEFSSEYDNLTRMD